MKMKKKLWVLVVGGILSAAQPLLAYTGTVGDYTWTYRINGDVAEIYNGSYSAAISPKPTGTVAIPSTLGGKPVTSIGDYAFVDCSGLTSVMIPSSVMNIGDRAFAYCSGLTSVTIPSSVTSIGDYAFADCSGLTSVTIPPSVTSIGDCAFVRCSGLTSVNITDLAAWCGILFSGSLANPLYYAKKLYLSGSLVTDLTIPSSVTSIGSHAFDGCSGLTSVTIPNSVTNIGGNAFDGCSGLTSVNITDLAAWCGILFSGSLANPLYYAKKLYLSGSLVTDLTIPSSVASIGDYAFYGYSGLTSVMIPSSVTNIGQFAFCYCSGLTSVTIPSSVTSIGQYAFRGCSLTSVTIPSSVASIGDYAFAYCSGLTSVTIPSSVTSIGQYAFRRCLNIEYYEVAVDNPAYKSDLGMLLTKDGKTLVAVACESTAVTIPDGVTSIDDEMFYGYSWLTSVTIPNSMTNIGKRAFYGCSGLTSVTIPNSVTNIGYGAFSGCSGLSEMTLPFVGTRRGNTGTSDSLLGYVFGSSSYVGGTGTRQDYDPYSSVTYYIPTNLTTVVITDETVLGFGAFYGCSGLTSVTIQNGVTNIGRNAFRGCSGLTDVTIPSSVTNIGWAAFYNCSGLTSVTIPDGVMSIGDDAFKGCSGLTDVTIPDSVTSIGDDAFEGCSGLTDVTIPDSVTSIGDYAFEGCSGLTSVTIGNGVTSIGAHAFQACSGLTSVTIPDSVTKMGDSMFEYCSGLTSVIIGNGVKKIGDRTFRYCSGLKSVMIGAGVQEIWNPFYNCSNLTSLAFKGNAPRKRNGSAFSSVGAECTAYVKEGSTGWDVDIPGTWKGLYIQYMTPEIEWLADRNLVADMRAANGRTAAECYALGLDPAVAADDFRITSFSMAGDEPQVEWEPKTNRWTGGELNAVLKGAESLEGPWMTVPSGGDPTFRFFKVEVTP